MELDFRQILDAFADAVLAASAAGEIVYANRRAGVLLGWPPEELVGQPLAAVIPDRLQQDHHAGFARYLVARQPRIMGRPVRVPALRRDGGEVEVELTLAELRAGEETVFVASLRDLTDRVSLERQLTVTRYLQAANRASAQLASHLDPDGLCRAAVRALVDDFDAALARIWLHDADAGTLRLGGSAGLSTETEHSSRATLDVETYPHPLGVVAREHTPFVRNGVAGDPEFDEAWMRREQIASVAMFPLLGGRQLCGVLAYFSRRELPPEVVDILHTFATTAAASLHDVLLFQREQAARAQAEEAVLARDRLLAELRESEEQFRSLIEQSPLSIQVLSPDGRTLQVNSAWERLWGLRQEALAGYNTLRDEQLVEKGVMPYILRAFAGEACEIPPIMYDLSQTLPHARATDDPRKWVRAVIYPVKDQRGRLAKVVLIHEDYTPQKRLEDELRERLMELAEADQRKDEFIATLAHELRNPLAAITSATYLLERIGSQEPRPSQLRHTIARQTEYLTRLVSDLLDVSRISRGLVELRPERVELGAVLVRSLDVVQEQLEARRHSVHLHQAAEGVFLAGDPLRLEQIFTNLLTNASKYTEPGGEITVTLTVEEQEEAPHSGEPEQPPARYAVVRVRDTGIGIDAETLPHIFDLFFQVDRTHARTHGGLGIGLNMVRRLVDLHSGRVEAHSEGPGQGSEFTVWLPLDS